MARIPGTKTNPVHRHGPIGSTIKRSFTLIAIGIVSLFGFLGLFGKNGVLDMIHLKSMQHDLQRENLNLLKKQEVLKKEISRLGSSSYVEYLARERLGLMRSNEIFLILDPPEPHSSIDKL